MTDPNKRCLLAKTVLLHRPYDFDNVSDRNDLASLLKYQVKSFLGALNLNRQIKPTYNIDKIEDQYYLDMFWEVPYHMIRESVQEQFNDNDEVQND